MDATQAISDSFLESDEEEYEEERRPLAKLCVLKNEHIPETELPLFLGENVLGRDSNFCTLPLPSPSVSKQHATICISVYRRRGEEEIEALVWDLGSMNGTRKGRIKLTPNVRYALSERDSLVVADIPCQYVGCAVDTVSSQGDSRTVVSENSGVKARLPDAAGEEGGDTSTSSKTHVNGGTEALPELEDTTKTPVRTGCLSFAPTPSQPEGTLVPESDVDSDGERGGDKDRRPKVLVSDSDSHKSSPSCSTFLSPTNKTIPESEDESLITPSSTKNRSHKRVSFSMDETDVDVGRQQLKEKKALVIADDSEEEEDGEEERAALKSDESGQHVPVKPERNVSLTGEDKLPGSRPALLTDAIPAFNMDSDTDVEGEEEGVASAGPVTLQTNQQADQPPNTAQFHMDSDTDVDEDDDALDKVPKPVPFSADNTKPPHVISVIQPEAITMNSDTDVDDDDDDTALSDAASKAQPVSFQSAHTADSAPSTQLKDFHLDSDTDVDEEEEKECATMNTSSKIDETPSRLDIEPIGPESAPAPHHSLHSDSDTDDEGILAPAISEPSAVSANAEPGTTADKRADLDTLSDSDTDVEADSPLVVPFVVTSLSFSPGVTSEALQSGSDADTDADESSVPPAGDAANPADLSVSSNINVEDEVDFGGAGEGQTPSLRRESTPGILAPPLQNCSTPVQSSEGQVEDMDTQAFLGPSSGPFRYVGAPAEELKALSSCSESQEDDDFVVDETQSFVLQPNASVDRTKDSTRDICLESPGDEKGEQSIRGGSFQLGLSDSSHLQGQAQALAMESTQAFVSADRGVNLEDTQAYAAILNAEITSLENDSNLEATQAYGKDEEPARCSVMSKKESQVDLALQATQAYISEPCSDSEDETENEKKDMASAETQPLDFPTSSTLAMAETQLMSTFKEEESVSSVLRVKPRPQSETGEKEEHEAHPQSVAETQPMHASDDEESDDEELIPGPRKRKAKLLHLEEEQTQPLTSCETQPMHIGVDETQPIATSGNEESDEEGSMPGPQKSKAKQLCIEEEQTQMLTNSELSAVETQPMDPGKDGGSDEEDSIPGPRKRKAKPLQLEDEQTQPLTSSEISTAETQPMSTCEGEQSDEEDSFPGPRKRKAKALQIPEEETQLLANSEASTVETQLLETKLDAVTSGVPVRGKRGTRVRLREEEEQAECSEPPKRQTRGRNKTLPTTRGRGKTRPNEDESEEEEKEEQTKRTRGKKTTRQQKDNQQENLERERKEKEEQERVQAENAERLRLEREAAEKETIEKERKEREEKERADRIQKEKEEQLERERKEKEEKERLEREKAEREEKERLEREEKVRIEKERKEKEEKERLETAKRELEERLEREAKEKEERERLEKEKQMKEQQERLEREAKEKEERERLEKEKQEKEAKEKQMKEQRERLEREAKEKEERERLKKEKQEKEAKEKQMKEQQERLEREAKEKEERERLEKEKREKKAKEKQMKEQRERLEREAKEKEERERLEKEKQEKEAKEKQMKEQQERLEREAKEKEEKERLEKETQEKEAKEKQIKEQQENKPARGRRAARRTTATTELKQDDDVPARRTRSRSNSSNSVSSERSAVSVNTEERGRGRGRGKGAKRTSEPPQAAIARSSNRRRTVAAGPTEEDSDDSCPQGVLSRSNSNNSLNSEISSCSLSSQSGRGRGRKTGARSIPPNKSQSAENSAPKPTARGRRSKKAEESSNVVPHEDDEEKADSQQAATTRGQQRANANDSKPATADEEGPSNKEEGCANEDSLLPKRNVRGRGQRAVKSETVEAAPAVSDGGEAKEKRKGRKRELEADTEDDSSSSSKIPKGKEKAQTTEEAKGETKVEIPVQVNRRGRGSIGHAKDSPAEVEVKGGSEKMEEEAVERRGRGRPSVVQKKKKEEQDSSVDQDAHAEGSEPQTPTSRASRKRQAPPDSSDAPKTPRSSSASPADGGRVRPAVQTYKGLFTGVVDEEGERVLTRLGGSIAKGVADMNFLVTDKVRRTLKFLCAVAKGVPIVTTHWLEKSGKAGSFLPPNAFVVKDPEQEKKFNFCLQDSLRIASSQPLLQGYEIHVTKSVKPEPDQMKDIITCSGATFLAKMPSSHKPQTVVISCEEDWSLCVPALSASLPVVTAEFILTGILQQKLDFQTHSLSAPTSTSQPAGGRGRGRKKT